MKPQYTPGPWKYHAQGDANQYALVTNTACWILGILQNGEILTPEQEANARLIAAAPELLQTLKDTCSELNQLAFVQNDRLAQKQVKIALALISKIEGE